MNNKIFKCTPDGMIVETLNDGNCELVCCGTPMVEQVENTVDASREKHVPVIEKTANGIQVKVGAAPHPMEQKHYIMWIEVRDGNRVYRQFLMPGQAPEAEFPINSTNVVAREYCNLHGLWKG